MMHVLGFNHEHNRFDRDKYVDVPSHLHRYASFKKGSFDDYTDLGLPYDNISILHYPAAGCVNHFVSFKTNQHFSSTAVLGTVVTGAVKPDSLLFDLMHIYCS